MKDYQTIITALEKILGNPQGYTMAHDLASHWLSEYCYRDNFCFLLREFLNNLESMEAPVDEEETNAKTAKDKSSRGGASNQKSG